MKFWALKKTPRKPLIVQKNSNLHLFSQHIMEIKEDEIFTLPKYTFPSKAVVLLKTQSQGTVHTQVLLNKLRTFWSLDIKAEFAETSSIIYSSMLETFEIF